MRCRPQLHDENLSASALLTPQHELCDFVAHSTVVGHVDAPATKSTFIWLHMRLSATSTAGQAERPVARRNSSTLCKYLVAVPLDTAAICKGVILAALAAADSVARAAAR